MQMMNRAIFLDRDGVINEERGDYTFQLADFKILPGVKEALQLLKSAGYLTIVITNQAGISRGIYSQSQMQACHDYLLKECEGLIDDIYFCPWHPTVSESIMRKPDSVMLEKAIAKYEVNPQQSWMVGDRARDLEAGQKVGLKGCLITKEGVELDIESENSIYPDLLSFAQAICSVE